MSARKRAVPVLLRRTEHDEQAALFAWIDLLPADHPAHLAFAIPNGAYKSWKQAAKFKAEGLKGGVPDIFLPCARGTLHGLFLEMKRAGGVASDVSPAQRAWHDALRDQRYQVAVCYGADQAMAEITTYLNRTTNDR